MQTVYILYSAELDSYYTGMTFRKEKRQKEHISGQTRSTKGATDWVEAYSKTVDNREMARELEKKIEKRGAKRFLNDIKV